MGWRRKWIVRINVLESRSCDREEIREITVDTIARLRAAVESARADPKVRRYRFERIHYLDHTDAPDRCGCGRKLEGPLPVRAERAWVSCRGCPGHVLYRCRGCTRVTVWPAPSRECEPAQTPAFGP
ncbi:MAG: hypothetical protein ACRDTM_06980 [Micromonosporaceae bacterium]